MYNKNEIEKLISCINRYNGIADKDKLADAIKKEFLMVKDRSVYYCEHFAIRFSKSEHKKMSNTVLSLSSLQKYDDHPFFVCIVSSDVNKLFLANTTFLKKISHSSKELRIDNIKGSFNGSDIMMEFQDYENVPSNFEKMYAFHTGLSFEDNLERLVESTNNIVGRVKKLCIDDNLKKSILLSVKRAASFTDSAEYNDLKADLDSRVLKVQGEIAIAAFIDNVNLRGRIIEYLITDNGSSLKEQIIASLHKGSPLPSFKTKDKLGDYSKKYPDYDTETDIKTKVLFLDGNPKAYNIDKLLEFLSEEKSVYMIYLLGIDENGKITGRLCSAFDVRLIDSTNVIHHWAGRNSRGVAQFIGRGLISVLSDENKTIIDEEKTRLFLEDMINR